MIMDSTDAPLFEGAVSGQGCLWAARVGKKSVKNFFSGRRWSGHLRRWWTAAHHPARGDDAGQADHAVEDDADSATVAGAAAGAPGRGPAPRRRRRGRPAAETGPTSPCLPRMASSAVRPKPVRSTRRARAQEARSRRVQQRVAGGGVPVAGARRPQELPAIRTSRSAPAAGGRRRRSTTASARSAAPRPGSGPGPDGRHRARTATPMISIATGPSSSTRRAARPRGQSRQADRGQQATDREVRAVQVGPAPWRCIERYARPVEKANRRAASCGRRWPPGPIERRPGRDLDAGRSQQRAAHQCGGGQSRPWRASPGRPIRPRPRSGRHRGAQIGAAARPRCRARVRRRCRPRSAGHAAASQRCRCVGHPQSAGTPGVERPRVLEDRRGDAASVDRVRVRRRGSL